MPAPRRPRPTPIDQLGMGAAIAAARRAAAAGEVPIGAAVVVDDQVVATAHNETVAARDLTRHAELTAIRSALESLGVDRLTDATLYATVEPCAQCAGAMVLARVGRVVFGAYEPRTGMAGSVGDLLRHPALNHSPEVRGGVMERECAGLLRDFFESRRGRSR